MYKPAAKRWWGYYALPVLHGDRLVGSSTRRLTATPGAAVDALHEDVPFGPDVRAAVEAEIEDLAGWLGLEVRYA